MMNWYTTLRNIIRTPAFFCMFFVLQLFILYGVFSYLLSYTEFGSKEGTLVSEEQLLESISDQAEELVLQERLLLITEGKENYYNVYEKHVFLKLYRHIGDQIYILNNTGCELQTEFLSYLIRKRNNQLRLSVFPNMSNVVKYLLISFFLGAITYLRTNDKDDRNAMPEETDGTL